MKHRAPCRASSSRTRVARRRRRAPGKAIGRSPTPTAAGSRSRRARCRSTTAGACRTRLTPARSARSSPHFRDAARARARRRLRVARAARARTATSSHEFLSPLANKRADDWGGSFDEPHALRRRGGARGARASGPSDCRCRCACRAPTGSRAAGRSRSRWRWRRALQAEGVDLIDCSSGGIAPRHQDSRRARLSGAARRGACARAASLTAAVGLITEARQADEIVRSEQADLVMLARELLRDPYWPYTPRARSGSSRRWRRRCSISAPTPARRRGRGADARHLLRRARLDRHARPVDGSLRRQHRLRRACAPPTTRSSCSTWAPASACSATSSSPRAGAARANPRFITHAHWDHIIGAPFFGPIYRKEAHVILHSMTPRAERDASTRPCSSTASTSRCGSPTSAGATRAADVRRRRDSRRLGDGAHDRAQPSRAAARLPHRRRRRLERLLPDRQRARRRRRR